jgi:predicted  nucleic acid-binding Zn-ribbon protein
MAVSKKGGFKSASKTTAQVDTGHNHDELNAKIVSLESKVLDLESKLAGVLASVETLAEVKNDLEEAKVKISSEVKELRDNAKSWTDKTKEAMDTNNDGKIDMEEIYSYIWRRLRSRSKIPKK